MNIIHYSIRSFFTNEYYSIIRFASKRLFVATLIYSLYTGYILHGVLCVSVSIEYNNNEASALHDTWQSREIILSMTSL